MRTRLVTAVAALSASAALAAADMLPLKRGVYLPVGTPCRAASNADALSYPGGDHSLGVAQATCRITRLGKSGATYTITERCTDLASGDAIDGPPTVVTIASPTSFRLGGTSYRHCAPKTPL